MRIDLNGPAINQLATEKQNKPEASKTEAHLFQSEDKATLSLDTVGLNQLETQALQSPEIRQEKVAALREAVRSGQYQVEPGKIADAMLNEFTK
jgi:flagellar biosynthesis anti-sigma factor FlgM